MCLLYFIVVFASTISVSAVYSTYDEKSIIWRQRLAAFYPAYAEWLPTVVS